MIRGTIYSLAVVGTLAIVYLAVLGLFSLEKKEPVRADLQPRFVHPLQVDAIVCQRGAAPDKWKCRPYIRRET